MAVKKKVVLKRKVNLLKLYSVMNDLSRDAVDREVIKRFKIIIDSIEEDISKVKMSDILKHYTSIALSDFKESLQPYVKHCVFMLKREKSR
jgi:hypothetical protein